MLLELTSDMLVAATVMAADSLAGETIQASALSLPAATLNVTPSLKS